MLFKLARLMVIVSFGLLGIVLEAQTKSDSTKTIDPVTRFKNSLLHKCEVDGIASACFQYSQALVESDNPDERKRATFYARRACTMAYAPACGRESDFTPSGRDRAPGSSKGCFTPEVFANLNLTPTSTKAGAPGQKIENVEKLPMFEKSGVRSGDIILSVNSKPLQAPSQIADGLDSGLMKIEIERSGQKIPLTVRCDP